MLSSSDMPRPDVLLRRGWVTMTSGSKPLQSGIDDSRAATRLPPRSSQPIRPAVKAMLVAAKLTIMTFRRPPALRTVSPNSRSIARPSASRLSRWSAKSTTCEASFPATDGGAQPSADPPGLEPNAIASVPEPFPQPTPATGRDVAAGTGASVLGAAITGGGVAGGASDCGAKGGDEAGEDRLAGLEDEPGPAGESRPPAAVPGVSATFTMSAALAIPDRATSLGLDGDLLVITPDGDGRSVMLVRSGVTLQLPGLVPTSA